jgi:Peptidase M50B-like
VSDGKLSKSTEDLIRELEADGALSDPALPTVAQRDATLAPRATKPEGGSLTSILLIFAVLLVAVVGSLPVVDLALYPFSLFVTLLHETGHAIAGDITGGAVTGLTVRPDFSGVTNIRGGTEALVAPAGYLGASIAGGAILALRTRFARIAVAFLAAVPAADLIFFHPGDIFTAVWCGFFLVGLMTAAWKLKGRPLVFLQVFLGVEIGLNAFRDLTTLILLSGSHPELRTDADQMSRALFFPSVFWAVCWTIVSLAILASAVFVVLRRDFSRRRE